MKVGRKDGKMERRKGGRTEGRTEGRKGGKMERRKGGRMEGWTKGRKEGGYISSIRLSAEAASPSLACTDIIALYLGR